MRGCVKSMLRFKKPCLSSPQTGLRCVRDSVRSWDNFARGPTLFYEILRAVEFLLGELLLCLKLHQVVLEQNSSMAFPACLTCAFAASSCASMSRVSMTARTWPPLTRSPSSAKSFSTRPGNLLSDIDFVGFNQAVTVSDAGGDRRQTVRPPIACP